MKLDSPPSKIMKNEAGSGKLALDDPQLEAYHEYKQRLGKWRRDTVQLCMDPNAAIWWQVFNIMRVVHGPTSHLFNFLLSRKYINKRGSHLAYLTCGKAAALFEEYSCLIHDNSCWTNQILSDSKATGSEQQELLTFGVLMVGNHAAGFHRRIVEPTSRCRS